jgi:hypothetical protein
MQNPLPPFIKSMIFIFVSESAKPKKDARRSSESAAQARQPPP